MGNLWVWQSPAWPKVTYTLDLLAKPLRRARTELGRLFGQAEMIGADEVARVERDVWSQEAVSTAAIEGETLDLASVRSSVGRRLGISSDFVATVPRNIEGLLDVMESAAADWDSELTPGRLDRWQAALFPAGGSALRPVATGRYREHDTPMEIVSGPIGRETVHYVAPPSAAVRAEMHSLLEWFNRTRDSSLDGILRAGLAHFWFETIHPYEDGNGRVGRAIIDMALAQDAHKPTRLHGMSIQLRRQQKAYYSSLNRAQRGAGDVTEWLTWFSNAFADSCRAGAELIGESLARARFWSDHKNVVINQRQRKVLGKMLDAGPGQFEGGLTVRKYTALTGISAVTAWRDIEDLLTKRLITRGQGAGRATHYNIGIPGWEWRGGARLRLKRGTQRQGQEPGAAQSHAPTDRQLTIDTARDALLATFPDAWAIYVYGSFARGDDSPSSDIDLAILLAPDAKIFDLLAVLSDVSTRVHREVDLVDLRRVSDVLRREVLAEGRQIYVSRPSDVLVWEGTAISRYQRYREEIRDLLDDFGKTGIGYRA